jgi:GMP synthase-like glutamine amidotransferase
MRFHCLQHVSFETPGLLADAILERGYALRITDLSLGDVLPSTADFDALIIMGGPMSVHDEDSCPWLKAEKELIAAAIGEKKKVLGICLGAQLIAEVAGGRVYPNPQKEIGFWPVYWTRAAESLFAGIQGQGSVPAIGQRPLVTNAFHWHGETFDLPPGAVLLASTPACPNQGFMLGDHVLGLQFHPEVTPGIIRAMIDHEGHELTDAPYIQTAAEMLQQAEVMLSPAAGRLSAPAGMLNQAAILQSPHPAESALISFLTH